MKPQIKGERSPDIVYYPQKELRLIYREIIDKSQRHEINWKNKNNNEPNLVIKL